MPGLGGRLAPSGMESGEAIHCRRVHGTALHREWSVSPPVAADPERPSREAPIVAMAERTRKFPARLDAPPGSTSADGSGPAGAALEQRSADLEGKHEKHAVAASLGVRVRNQRKQLGLTLDEFAARSGVSRAMISKVERSEKSPTLSVLVRLAAGLNLTLSSLLGSQPDKSEVSIIRMKDRVIFRDPESGFERHALSQIDADNGVEILMHRIPAGQSSGVLPVYSIPTEKYVIVQEGELVVHLNDQDRLLGPGDTIHFEITTPYTFSNPGKMDCTYYVMLVRRPK
ncbi:Transcriptional regulator with XRE-family HTH domain [Chelatococcus asaccharovorans]|nr:Transcriptional regulator with XRE-family HTH domain [Chelatococcus asaccharovorans]CAH1681530.1 Transcriptional regulator with XRE-family HTH domain [Chelatococcus asaccharovorans]